MKIAICDDEPQELQTAANLLAQYNADLNVTKFSSADALYQAFFASYFDIILLDIEMPEPNGYEIAKKLMISTKQPLIIFITKSTEYAVRGYDVAFHYLVKPIKFTKLCEVMDRALKRVQPCKLSFSSNGIQIYLPIDDILYVEVMRWTTIIHCKIKQYQTRISMKEMVQKLSRQNFYRTHNSFLVNLQYIDRVSPNELILCNGEHIPISRANQKGFQTALQQYLRMS